MRESFCTFDYAVIRFVPRVEREEFFNVGVILSCPEHKFLDAKFFLDEKKSKCFAPEIEAENVREYLDIIEKICAGDESAGVIGKLTQRERFYFLTAQRSTVIQTSPVHTGFTNDAKKTLDNLLKKLVE